MSIVFRTACDTPRPIRLSEKTRSFAYESLQGKYGDLMMETPFVCMDSYEGFENLTPLKKHDAAIMKVVKECPIRICENETVSGSSTLGHAHYCLVPAMYKDNFIFSATSHLTMNFARVLRDGLDSMRDEAIIRAKDTSLDSDGREFLESILNTDQAIRIWHARYMEQLEKVRPDIAESLRDVPFRAPKSFREGVQSLWFTFAFTRLCGNWPGIGRIDQMLGNLLENDLKNNVLTIDEAREILAGFFIKGCEWIMSSPARLSGDAQHYQNLVIGGIDEDGREVTNDVTYLVLDIVEELPIGDFPITVRVNEHTPEKLLRRVSEVVRHGGGTVAVYNETLIIDALTDFGYPLRDARGFANDGCWEVIIPGKTEFSYHPFDSLKILLKETMRLDDEKPPVFGSYEELYEQYKTDLAKNVDFIFRSDCANRTGSENPSEWKWINSYPCTVASYFTDGCVNNARSYFRGGPVYCVRSPHIGGAPDTGNSLYAIKKLVFEEKKASYDELVNALKNDWKGFETLRSYVASKYTYYGNDCDESDAFTVKLLDDFADMVLSYKGKSPVLFPPGVSTFGRQIEWAPQRGAVPFGMNSGKILSGNASPTPGTDTKGATAIIRSYCKANMKKLVCGSALDIKLFPGTASGENGVAALSALVSGFRKLGGYFMQIDVIDAAELKKAQQEPENYKTLSVRVSGWNARFVTLNEEWQNMIIERTAQNAT